MTSLIFHTIKISLMAPSAHRLPLPTSPLYVSCLIGWNANWCNLSNGKSVADCYYSITGTSIARFTINSPTRVNEFRGFLSQFRTNFHKILHTLFSIHVMTTLTISRSISEVRLFNWHVGLLKFWGEANFIEGDIYHIYLFTTCQID